ncbi:MAG: hypothetical protein J3K34DRAFT_439610 [Monoraphidium minutum]|nr:MAG: hypothetical protein J3K34DRAFT_439610 [Monoraphidium minutum]
MAAAEPVNDCGLLYHLVQSDLWAACKAGGAPYYPPTYASDGFIHLTKEAALLLPVANHFYTGVPGDFLVLEIDSRRLAGKVVFEPAAPVGTTPAKPAGGEDEVLFPHLYGTIDFSAVGRELPVARGEGGSFLGIGGLEGAA